MNIFRRKPTGHNAESVKSAEITEDTAIKPIIAATSKRSKAKAKPQNKSGKSQKKPKLISELVTTDQTIVSQNKAVVAQAKSEKPEKPAKPEKTSTSLLTKVWVALGLLGCMIGAFVISRFVLAPESLRLDESQSIWQTAHSLQGMLEIVAQDVHVPLYHIILHYWMIAFGNGVVAVRSLSLIFFLLTIPFVYLLSRTILSRRWALFVTALFSFNPFMNWYANEARMYTMLAFFSVLNQYFFIKIVKRTIADGTGKAKGWLGYTITAIIGAYTHYFFIFNLLTQALFFLANKSKFQPGTFKRLLGVALAVIIALSPWIAYFVMQGSAGNTRPLIQSPSTVDFFNAYSQFLFGFQTDSVNTIIVSCWPLLVVAAFFTVKRHLKVDIATSYLLVAALLPVLLAFCLSFVITPFFLSRYMVPVVTPLLIVIAWLLSRYYRYSKAAVITLSAIGIAIVGMSFTQQTVDFGNPVRENYSQAADYITEKAKPSDIIVLSAPFTVYPFEYYYDGSTQIRTLPIWDRQNVGPVPAFEANKLPEQANTLIKGHDYVYLLLSHDQGYSDNIYQYFNNRYERTYTEAYSDDLSLYVYRVGYRELPKINTLKE